MFQISNPIIFKYSSISLFKIITISFYPTFISAPRKHANATKILIHTIAFSDRKKDLVKLQFGEYVSLGKVEAELKVCPSVENICVYGDSSKNNIVAIMCPIQKNLEDLGRSLGKLDLRREKLCLDEDINRALLQELVATGKKGKKGLCVCACVYVYFGSLQIWL